MKTSLSYWEQATWYSDHDYCIIGGGIVGMTTAIALRKLAPEAKICIIDRGHLPTGGSTKNAGFMCFGSVGELAANIRQYGIESTLSTVKLRLEGLNLLRSLTGDHAIDYRPCGGYEITTSSAETEGLISHIPYLNTLLDDHFGLKETYSVQQHQVGQQTHRLIYNQYEGSIHTGKLITTLLRLCHQAEILMLPSTQVISYHNDSGLITIETDTHPVTVTCRSLLLCTNAFTPTLADVSITPQRNQVIVTTPVEHNLLESCYHYHQGYVYFRPLGDQILIGGGRHLFAKSEQTDDFGNTHEVTQYLLDWVRTHLLSHQQVDIAHQWSGILGTGDPLLPLIHEVEPNVYVAAKMNGMGVAIGAKVGQLLAEMTVKG